MERIRMCLLDPDLAKINTEKSHINKHKIYYFPCRLFFRPIFNSMDQDPFLYPDPDLLQGGWCGSRTHGSALRRMLIHINV